jgi:plasmid stabilization system protein ParE
MKFFLHPQAQEELEQTVLFYKQQQAGLEKRFIEAVKDAINRACRNPLLYRKSMETSESAGFCIFLKHLFFEQKLNGLK